MNGFNIFFQISGIERLEFQLEKISYLALEKDFERRILEPCRLEIATLQVEVF